MVLRQKLLVKTNKYSMSKQKDLNWPCYYLLDITITYHAKHVTDHKVWIMVG